MDILRVDTLSLTLGLSVLVLVFALIWRHKAGFGYGKTISHDNVRLSSKRYMLRGKPDRIVQRGRYFIPEEKKSGLRLTESYQAQLGVYFILIEEEYGVRPPYGFLVLGDGRRVKVKNTRRLRSLVIAIAERIREHRHWLDDPLPPPATPAKCRNCGQRQNCEQRLV